MATRPESERNNTQIALIAGLVVVLLVIVYFLFLRGDGEPEPVAVPPSPSPTVVVPPEDEEVDEDDDAASTPGQGPVETFEVFAARDPFKPLITADAGTGATGDTATDGTTGTDGANGTDGTNGTNGTNGTDGTTGSNGGQNSSGQNVSGHRVKLVDVFTRDGEPRAQVQVDSTVYTVSEGETFADNFKLLSISGSCASLLFGDDQFTLCEGEEILK